MQAYATALGNDFAKTRCLAVHAKARNAHQGFRFRWERSVPIDEFGGDVVHLLVAAGVCQSLVRLEAKPFRRHVLLRQMRGYRQFDFDLGCSLVSRARAGFVLCESLTDKADVQVEADVGDVAALLAPQQVACTSDRLILQSDLHS